MYLCKRMYFYGISFFSGYLMQKPLVFLFNLYIGGKGVYNFSEDICPKLNVIARLEFEITY